MDICLATDFGLALGQQAMLRWEVLGAIKMTDAPPTGRGGRREAFRIAQANPGAFDFEDRGNISQALGVARSGIGRSELAQSEMDAGRLNWVNDEGDKMFYTW